MSGGHARAPSYQANRGRALEELVDFAFKQCKETHGRTVLFRQANTWVPLKRGAKAYPLRGAPIDFLGAAFGVPIAIECKEVGKGRRLPLHRSRIPEKEVAALKNFEEAGGRSFIVAAFWEMSSLAVIPFSQFYTCWNAYKKKGGRASILLGEKGAAVPMSSFTELPAVIFGFLGKYQ